VPEEMKSRLVLGLRALLPLWAVMVYSRVNFTLTFYFQFMDSFLSNFLGAVL